MNILELAILKKMVGGGGGSGTDNYNDLSNLPQINGETLAGNKTAENLGLQDALTFDSTPTEDSTNPVESGGVYNALAGKQDNLTFDGVYNASTNKAATESTVTNAIAGLDVSEFSVDANETISSISETDGKVSVNKQDIAIASSQVVAMTGYTKPSSAPATPAIQQGDTANQAFGKLEFKADTNQSNIWYAINNGATNQFFILNGYYQLSSVASVTADNGALTFSNSATYTSNAEIGKITLKAGTYVLTNRYVKVGGSIYGDIRLMDGETNLTSGEVAEFTIGTDKTLSLMAYVYTGSLSNPVTIKPLLYEKELWDQKTDYMPPALPNYDLTRLEAEDRAALAEEIDAGAKNLWDFANATFTDVNGASTKTATTLSIASNSRSYAYTYTPISLKAGNYVISTTISSYSGNANAKTDFRISAATTGANPLGYKEFTANGTYNIEFTIPSTGTYYIVFYANSTSTASATSYTAANNMVCTKAAFGVSPKFVPYAKSNYQLTTDMGNVNAVLEAVL